MKKVLIIIAVLLVLIAGIGLAVRSMLFPLKYKSEIQKYAKEYNIEPELLAAVIQVRSNFDAKKYEKGEACGLMAIQGESAEVIAKEMGLTDFEVQKLDDPETSIKIGAWFIANNYKDKDFTKFVEKLGGISWQHAKPDTKEEERKSFGENHYKQYFVEKIQQRTTIYKYTYPTL